MAKLVELDADFFLHNGDKTVVAIVDPANPGDALFFKNRKPAQRVLAALEAREAEADVRLSQWMRSQTEG